MFRELSYASGIVSIITCGTEIIYRVKERDVTDYYYQLQSTYLIVAAGVQIPISYFVFRNIARFNRAVLKVVTVLVTAMLIVAIFLRSKNNFFMPLESQYSLYNVTSFFLCLQLITFALLFFYNEPVQSEQQEDVVVLEDRRRRRRRRRNGSTASVHEYDDEIDYTLPSYSEVPAPPAYTKATTPDEDVAVSLPESSVNNSSQNDASNPHTDTHISIHVPEHNDNNTSRNSIDEAESTRTDRQTATTNATNTNVAASQVVPPE